MENIKEDQSLEEIRRLAANRVNSAQGLYKLAQSQEEINHLFRLELKAILEERREDKHANPH
jgi:hypothetical protein